MADLGKVVVTDGGTYSASTTYEKLTFVHYGSDTYMTLKTVKGITPTDDGVNYRRFCRSAELATSTVPGTVKPDGATTAVDTNGTLSVKAATQTSIGAVKGSNGIKVTSGGVMDVNTTFTQATELANIIAGEAIALVLGKISKTIATTMDLNQNALLKNMLTNIDANDQNKIPTAAFIHTLYDRIGMGENLEIGANLTAIVKALNTNLGGIKFYTDVAKVTSITDPTINQVCYSMPANSVLISNINNFSTFPKTWGNLFITCNQSRHCSVRLESELVASGKYYEYAYYAKRNSNGSVTGSGWKTIYADT